MKRIILALSLLATPALAQPLKASSAPIATCTPMIFSYQMPGEKTLGDALIVNADGTIFVDWPRLKAMSKMYSFTASNVNELQAWAMIQAVLANRSSIKTVSRDRADQIAHLSAIRGDCDKGLGIVNFAFHPFKDVK